VKEKYDDPIERIAFRKLVYGEDHPEVALVHNIIGNCYNKQQEFEKLMNSYREALHIYRSIYGDYNPIIASTLQNIGNVHCCLGKIHKILRAVLTHTEEIPGTRSLGCC